jgi:Mg-chelatase subunit ChlI
VPCHATFNPAPQIRQKAKAGEQLPIGSMKIPMVDLPLGATEDRVCGTIDIEKALTEGGWWGCDQVMCVVLDGLRCT